MRGIGAFVVAGVFALVCFGVGYAVGDRVGYGDGYWEGSHDVCARLSAFEVQLSAQIKAVPNLDSARAAAVLTLVTAAHNQACSR